MSGVFLRGDERARYVRAMFTRIAPHYDLMNRLMTFGQDQNWRKEIIRRTNFPPEGTLLDIGTGTGDLSRETRRQFPNSRIVAVDFTPAMMLAGKNGIPATISFSGADALHLPFEDNMFDAVVSGFLLRNVIDIPTCLAEQYRVLKPGRKIATLDTTRPRRNILSPFIHIYLHKVIPRLGQWLADDNEAYTYLPDSTENFLEAETLAAQLTTAGFIRVGFQRKMFGAVALHWGQKPARECDL
ncbi:MAG: ubiquinone/menaquinone biosynthesis methyltransferase [Anaerolineales bacterium]|nr:ubiquinone/menaquinone biosynthesis methyltransferase [Anaerolineales bacterium]